MTLLEQAAILVAIAAVLSVIVVIALALIAPVGFEGEDGFHLGEQDAGDQQAERFRGVDHADGGTR